MKIVINTCYGGFGLSREAGKWLLANGIEEPFKTQIQKSLNRDKKDPLSGGICIMTYLNRHYGNQYQILTLGEDNGWHFLNSADTYCRYYKSKLDFVSLLFEAISLFNNEVYDN